MTDVLIVADTVRSPELRHEIPLAVPDAFAYLEVGGERHAVAPAMEIIRLRELPNLNAHPLEEFGYDELVAAGLERELIYQEVRLRACQELGVASAVVPWSFPLETADHLRANGIEVEVDRELFDLRRRVKNDFELEGIRRAQRATEEAMATVKEILHRSKVLDGVLDFGGEVVTSELLKARVGEIFNAHNCASDSMIISHGSQTAIGHDDGSGPIAPGEPVVVDLYPRDRESGCYADMTRTFVVGVIPDEIGRYHELCLEALQRAVAGTKAGAECKALHLESCDIFEAAGYPTTRTKEPGKPLEDGFYHSLGHGVGLDVHEEPLLGLASTKTLLAGDVVTVEPGLYKQGFGGVRLEDLLYVTEDGNENLTHFPYDLEP
jgi:Xaa-Pro aminopeptidase